MNHARLARHTNRLYRLPTEAEWEYACRAGTTMPFHFGATICTDYANYRGTDDKAEGWSGSYGDGLKGEYRGETTPVNHFEGANAYGLCDMHGNIDEWCQDHWHRNYEGTPTDGSAWLSSDKRNLRVIRGGSWADPPVLCRSATRDGGRDPYLKDGGLGFRVACSAPLEKSLTQDKSKELRRELLTLLRLACQEGLQDRTIAQQLGISEREIRDYWLQAYELLGIAADEEKQDGRNLRITACVRAEKMGFL